MKTWTIAAAALCMLAATGCNKKKPAVTTGDTNPPAATETSSTVATGEEVRTGLPDPKGERITLGKIYFEFDAATLSDEAKATLKANAETLLGNVEVHVRLEGHADERGSTQYNAALGDRRANAVKTYLNALGVPSTRLEVVSYGEEKPSNKGHDEAAWSSNRRVELAVTAGADKVSSSYGNATR